MCTGDPSVYVLSDQNKCIAVCADSYRWDIIFTVVIILLFSVQPIWWKRVHPLSSAEQQPSACHALKSEMKPSAFTICILFVNYSWANSVSFFPPPHLVYLLLPWNTSRLHFRDRLKINKLNKKGLCGHLDCLSHEAFNILRKMKVASRLELIISCRCRLCPFGRGRAYLHQYFPS